MSENVRARGKNISHFIIHQYFYETNKEGGKNHMFVSVQIRGDFKRNV